MNKLMQNTKTPGWWSEPKNIATAIVGLALTAGLAYGFLTYVLPWLVKVTRLGWLPTWPHGEWVVKSTVPVTVTG